MPDVATILWQRLDRPGHEVAELMPTATGWRLAGVALLSHGERPCRLDYLITCDAAWRTGRCAVRGHLGATAVVLDVARDAAGAWRVDGEPVAALAGCEDVDLGFSPSTNLLPIRRLGLAVGRSAPVRAAWVRFPELTVEVLEQVYTRLGPNTYLYESADGAFRRELEVDASGLVVHYPGLWRAEARSGAQHARR